MTDPIVILLVEDEAAHVEAIRRAFEAADAEMEIQVAGSLREYRAAVAARPPDLALMDLNLPDGPAMEVLTLPPAASPFPILIMTSYGNEQIAVEAMKAGALDYVVKSPEVFAEMPYTVARALRDWNLLRERQRAAEALRESEQRYRTLVETAPVVIYTLAADDGRITSLNPAFEVVTGWSPKEWRGKTFAPLVHPEDRPLATETFQQVLRGEYPPAYELRILAKSGEYLIGEFMSRPQFEGGKVIGELGIARDITEHRRAAEALRELSLQLSRAEDKERRRIARELHDSTGQKLAALSMTVGLLSDATGAPDRKTEQMFANCLAMIQQCAQEIRTLSYLLHPPLLDELGLAAAIGNYAEGFSKRSGVPVALDAPPGLERLPAEVEVALFRVVQESLGNIHRHAGASAARLRLTCDAEQVTLEVSDQGRGLSAETIRAIAAGRGSAGLGIAGMRERLRLLGGRLEIESGGQGTTVRAIIPRRPEPT